MTYLLREVDGELWHRCKVRALDERRDMRAVLLEFLADYGKPGRLDRS